VRSDRLRRLLCRGLVWLVITGVAPATAAGREVVLGVMPYQTPRTLIAAYQPLAHHLEAGLGRPVRLVTAPDVKTFGQRILAGDYDLVLAPAHLVRLAQTTRGWQPLACNRPDNTVLIVARRDSPLRAIADLKGRIVATADRGMLFSLAGERYLAAAKLIAGRDYQIIETGGQASSVYAVVSGQADAAILTLAGAAMSPSQDLSQVRVLADAGTIPHLVYAARPGFADARRAQDLLVHFSAPGFPRIEPASAKRLAALDVYLDATRDALGLGQPAGRRR
jgi:phosphonate transport system substrate-binding protein